MPVGGNRSTEYLHVELLVRADLPQLPRIGTVTPPPHDSARGPYAKGVERRREILERTLEVFAEHGFGGTSLRAIGEAIGVSHSALKHYFPSREALLLEVLRVRDDLVVAESATAGGSPLADLSTAAESNVKVPGLIALYTSMAASAVEQGNEASRVFFADRFARGRDSIGARVAADQRAGRVRADVDPRLVAALVMAASDGLQIQWSLDPSSQSITDALAELERLLLPPQG